jgi:hypothetical protein
VCSPCARTADTRSSIVLSLACLLDLNSLHNLSLTCRQIRGTLLLFRDQLVTRTLRCVNEENGLGPAEKLAIRFKESREAWRAGADRMANSPETVPCRRITSGKVGQCARDMVGECRRCGVVVCRVCVSSYVAQDMHLTPKTRTVSPNPPQQHPLFVAVTVVSAIRAAKLLSLNI